MQPDSIPTVRVPAETSAYDNPAFRNVLRKIVDTPKEEVECGLAAQKTERIAKRKKSNAGFDAYLIDLDNRVRSGELTGKDPFPDPNPPEKDDEDGLD
jgi:hypothetical protein